MGKRNALAKAAGPQSVERIEGEQIGGELCQQVSTSRLTSVDAEDEATSGVEGN
jgi:hypothetical protein